MQTVHAVAGAAPETTDPARDAVVRSLLDAQRPVFDADYADQVYAALLGKVIGVYLGRPFEGWSHERIMRELGEIEYYVHDRVGVPLIVTDDDISGTLTFFRAVRDSGAGVDVTADDVADTWLNYLIEGRSVLWWGGMSNSTEHTAYLRLQEGIRPPESGSAALNGRVVSEQIGAQIFIDCWGLMCPGMPTRAAELARRAAVVSHDGEAVWAAQALAAMIAAAFTTHDIDALLDVALAVIPRESLIATLITDVRTWHREIPNWRDARDMLDREYGYHRYGGGCHVIPNHGLVILGLLYGGGDFSTSMRIVNTCGWDTDCNSGNLGTIVALLVGLDGIGADGVDWRGPVADRIYLPTADVGRGISDVLREALEVVDVAHTAAELDWCAPKDGARFSFALPGAVQGFDGDGHVENVAVDDERGLLLRADRDDAFFRTPTWVQPDAMEMTAYRLAVAPTLWPGQTVRARVRSLTGTTRVALAVQQYTGRDDLVVVAGPRATVSAEGTELTWTMPDTDGQPIAGVGFVLEHAEDAVIVDRLDWSGSPNTTLTRPSDGGTVWRKSVVRAFDYEHPETEEPFRLVQNRGWGRLLAGCSEWHGYDLDVTLTPHACRTVAVLWASRGLRRGCRVEWAADGTITVIRQADDDQRILAVGHAPRADFAAHRIRIRPDATGWRIQVDDTAIVAADRDGDRAGGIGIGVEVGRLGVDAIRITPTASS